MATHEASAQQPHNTDTQPCSDNCGTLILDGRGCICGSGGAAESLFGGAQHRLIGKKVSGFIVGILPEKNSFIDDAMRLLRLCANNEWQQFVAVDSYGHMFSIEIYFLRRMANQQEVFVLNLRLPEKA